MATTLRAESFSSLNTRERTELDASTAPLATELTVVSNQGLSADQIIYVGTLGREGCEKATIKAVSGATGLTTYSGLTLAHTRFEDVTAVVGDQVKFYRAANVDGTMPADDAFSALGTVDINPDNLSTYYRDPDGSSAYWYRWTYINAATGTETDPTAPIRGDDFGHYASLREIRVEAGFKNAYNLSDSDIEEQRRAAESEINARLVNTYTVPFSPIPELIHTLTVKLAASMLQVAAYGKTPETTQRLKEVDDTLTALTTGTMLIPGADGLALATPDAVTAYPDAEPEEGGAPRAFRMTDIY